MQESGRSAKEKPSRKGWASMCDISLIVLRGRLSSARKHHMTFFSESHRCRLISPPPRRFPTENLHG